MGLPLLAKLKRTKNDPRSKIYRTAIAIATGRIAEPLRGGTYLYCPWTLREKREGGNITIHSCGIPHVGWMTGSRFRTEKAYRRHWRKQHDRNAA